MILYHGSTVYHSLCAIVHKLAYHPNDKAELLLVQYMFPEDEMEYFIRNLKATGWFEQIRIVPESDFAGLYDKSIQVGSSTGELRAAAKRVNREVTKWLGCDLASYDEIYLLAEQWSVGLAILYQKLPNYYFEDGSGLLGDEERYFRIVKEVNLKRYLLLKYLGGGGNNEFTKAKYCNMEGQPDGFFDRKAVDFNIAKIIREKIPQHIPDLLRLYHGEKVECTPDREITLFMTQFIRSMAVQNLDVQKQMTAFLFDYFVNPHSLLVIKPHPKDKFLDYNVLAPGCLVLDRRLPSELLPFVFDRPVRLALTASSTSVHAVSDMAKMAMHFEKDIESHFYELPLYDAVVYILEHIYNGQKVVLRGREKNYIENFLRIRYQTMILKEHWKQSCIYVNPGKNEGIGEKDVCIFTDPSGEFLLDAGRKAECYMIAHICVRQKNRSCFYKLYIYTQSRKKRRELEEIVMEKQLHHAGAHIEMYVEPADRLRIEQGKQKALLHILKDKESELQDKVLLEMSSIIDSYQKKNAERENLLAKEGWRGECI